MVHPEIPARRKSVYRWDFGRPFDLYMEAQKVPWVTPHIMRHTFASLLASAGVSIYKIAKWLGDDVRTVQRHYAKLLPNDSEIERAFSDFGSPFKAASTFDANALPAGKTIIVIKKVSRFPCTCGLSQPA